MLLLFNGFRVSGTCIPIILLLAFAVPGRPIKLNQIKKNDTFNFLKYPQVVLKSGPSLRGGPSKEDPGQWGFANLDSKSALLAL